LVFGQGQAAKPRAAGVAGMSAAAAGVAGAGGGWWRPIFMFDSGSRRNNGSGAAIGVFWVGWNADGVKTAGASAGRGAGRCLPRPRVRSRLERRSYR